MNKFNYFRCSLLSLSLAMGISTLYSQETATQSIESFRTEYLVQGSGKKGPKYTKGILYILCHTRELPNDGMLEVTTLPKVVASFDFQAGSGKHDKTTAYGGRLAVLNPYQKRGFGTELMFCQMPQFLHAAGFKFLKWRAAPFAVSRTFDRTVLGLPLPATKQPKRQQEAFERAAGADDFWQALSDEEYAQQLPKLCAYYQKRGARPDKNDDGSLRFIKDEETGRDEIEFTLDLVQHLANCKTKA